MILKEWLNIFSACGDTHLMVVCNVQSWSHVVIYINIGSVMVSEQRMFFPLSTKALFGFDYLFDTVKRGKMTDHDQDSLIWQSSSSMSRKFLPWILLLIASVQTLAPNDVIL